MNYIPAFLLFVITMLATVQSLKVRDLRASNIKLTATRDTMKILYKECQAELSSMQDSLWSYQEYADSLRKANIK